jgi:hypothetical protein
MNRSSRLAVQALTALVVVMVLPAAIGAQRRAVPRHPPHPQPAVTVRGHVFIGGYFYDPVFGPYPWWPRAAYPRWYVPIYDRHAELRLRIEPKAAEDAAVYVDGFYAGIVDDFNSVFQGLPLTPGGHHIVLFLEGYRTVRHNIYLRPGSTFSLRETMQRLPSGETSEPPEVAPPVPPPPTGSYRAPVTPPRVKPRAATQTTPVAAGFGTLDLYVQPADAEVSIDGQRWVSSDEGHFMVQVPAGKHHIEVGKTGYRHFATDVGIGEGETNSLNVSLMAGTR